MYDPIDEMRARIAELEAELKSVHAALADCKTVVAVYRREEPIINGELLAALKACIAFFESDHGDGWMNDACLQARSAIAKAEGKGER